MMDNDGQPNSNDFRAIAPSINNSLTREEYLLRKAKIDDAREKLAQLELEIELQETMRQGREAEQKLARMRTEDALLATGPLSASGSNYHPHANHQSIIREVPLTARIEGEVQDLPSNTSRPPTQVPSTYYNYQHNHPMASQPQQASLQAQTPQFPNHRSSFGQMQAQASTRSQSSHARPYSRAPAFSIHGYQHSLDPSSTPSYSFQKMQTGQSYQPQRLSEEYWAQQSQKYATELAAVSTRPKGQTSSAGVNPRATLLSGTVMPQAHARSQTPLPAATSETALSVSSTLRTTISTETQSSLDNQSSGSDPAMSAPTKQEFIRRFQIVCENDAVLIRSFLSTWPVSLEWLTEAVSSVDPANLKDVGAFALLNDMRKHLKHSAGSTSSTSDVRVHKAVDASSKTPTTTVQPSPPPTDLTNFDTKEKYILRFHEIYQLGGVDKAADFLRNQLGVPQEWQQALVRSLAPELVAEMHHAWDRARRRVQEAAKTRLASKSDASLNSFPNSNTQQNRSQTTIPNEVATQFAPMIELPKPVPVPPRPSVTRKTQPQSTNAQPSQTSTSNHTTATTSAASAAQTAPAPTKQTAPLAPSTQTTAFSTLQQQPLTGTIPYGSHHRAVHPPLSIPTADGKHVDYVYDPYLNQYVRWDIIAKRQPVPSNSSAPGSQQPPTVVVPQAVSAPTQVQATISIPSATPPRVSSGTATAPVRTPQQANKSQLARDILRSLGMDELPVVAADEDDDEEADVLDNLPVTTERHQETAQTQDSSHEPSYDPRDISLVLPPDNTMEQDQQPPAQSPVKATIIDLTMDDEANTTAPGDGATSPISPSPTTAMIPASTLTNRDDLRPGVNEISPLKSPSPTAILDAASVFTNQDELANGVDGMSIASDLLHHLDPSREDAHMDSVMSFPDLDEPLPPLPIPARSSSPAPSFRAQSREQVGDIVNGVLPLFLPSPSASPAPSERSLAPLPPETDDEVIIVENMLRGVSSSKRRVDLDALLLDDERSLTPPQNVRRKKGQRVYVLVPPPPPHLRRAIKKRKLEESGMVSGSEEEESKYNDFEGAFMADCKFRMVERPCQWAECDALLNSGENLYLHLKLHTQETSSKGVYICHWQYCPRRFKSEAAMVKHLQRHAYFPLPCPIANCSDVFDEPFKAIEHEVRQRRESATNLAMKQPPNPHVPKIPPKLDPPPHILPSHRVEPRYIRQAHIPPQRHNVIGPWVLQHIFSPVEQNLRKQNAPMRLRYPRQDARPEDLDNLRARPDEYDFLTSLSTQPTRNIRYDDLDSAGVSLALHEGLTLWDTGSDSDSRPVISDPKEEENTDPGKDVVMRQLDETKNGGASRSTVVEDSMMLDAEMTTVDLGMYGSQWVTEGGAGEERLWK